MYQGKFDAKSRGQQAPEQALDEIIRERDEANAAAAAKRAQRDAARLFQQTDGGGVIRSDIRGKKAGGAARRLAQDINVVLHGAGDAGQGAGNIRSGRGVEGCFAVKGDVGVGCPVRLNGVRRQVDQFGRGEFLAAQAVTPLGQGALNF